MDYRDMEFFKLKIMALHETKYALGFYLTIGPKHIPYS